MRENGEDFLFVHVFELEFDGYLITSNLEISSKNVPNIPILKVARPIGVHFSTPGIVMPKDDRRNGALPRCV